MIFVNSPDGTTEIRFQSEDEEKRMLDILRPHGEWIKDNMTFGFCDVRCSFCNSEYLDIDHLEKWNFCPCCGARMEKEGEQNE